MSKAPSDATQLRSLKSEFNHLRNEFKAMREQRDQYRVRATKAEQEAKEWRDRFDILLHKTDKG